MKTSNSKKAALEKAAARASIRRAKQIAKLKPTIWEILGDWKPRALPTDSLEWWNAICGVERARVAKIEAELESMRLWRVSIEAAGSYSNARSIDWNARFNK